MLPAESYKLVPPELVDVCSICLAPYRGAGSGSQSYVSVQRDPDPEERGWVPPALVELVKREPGQTIVEHRLYEGRTLTVRPAMATWCDSCVAQAARLIGLEDSAPLRAVIAEKNREAAEREATIAAREARVAELEDAVRDLRRKITIQSVREKPAKPRASKAAA